MLWNYFNNKRPKPAPEAPLPALPDRHALHQAALSGDEDLIIQLLFRGVDPNVRSRFNSTALHWAARKGHARIALILMQYGNPIDAQDLNGDTPLWWAAYWGQESLVKLLLAHGAQVNIGRFSTPLHAAYLSAQENIALLLVEAGADLFKKDQYGRGPEDCLPESCSGFESLREKLSVSRTLTLLCCIRRLDNKGLLMSKRISEIARFPDRDLGITIDRLLPPQEYEDISRRRARYMRQVGS